MADYYPLIARAVAGLEKNSGDGRRALYERARAALVAQLRGATPALPEAEITRERLSLEEAIRKVEAEAARRTREEAGPQPRAPTIPLRQPPQRPEAAMHAQEPVVKSPATAPGAPRRPLLRPEPQDEPPARYNDAPHEAAEAAPQPRPQPPQPRPNRDPLHGIPAAHDFDQLEPALNAETLDERQYTSPPDYDDDTDMRPPRQPREDVAEPREVRRPLAPPLGALTKIFAVIVLLAGLGALAYWQRDTIRGMYQAFRGQAAQTARDASQGANQARPKIADRIGPGTSAGQGAIPAVAQRVVLYEEEPNDPQGKRYLGSAIWRTETVSPGPGQPPELAVRADVEIPERKMTMTFSIRRNTDQTLPASHTIEIVFNLPADFAPGGVANVPGVLMKQAEQARGTPLAGLAVKVTNGFFLIGLSAVDSDFQRNIALLKERSWFDIPVVYNNNRRAILAIEKGTPGERAFAEAFATWRQ